MKKYKLYIQPEKLKEYQADPWTDEKISGSLLLEGSKYEINLAFRGYQIRDYPKKSYDLDFIKVDNNNQASKVHLNAEYMDPSLIRNKLSLSFFSNIGVLSPQTEHVLLYLNGVFKGVYLQLESIDQNSLKSRGLPEGPIFYATNDDANFSLLSAEGNPKCTLLDGYTRKAGTERDDQSIIALLIKINTLTNDEFYHEIPKLINIEKYLKWLAGVVCTHNYDGFVHNYALYQNSETGLFEMSPWDFDATWGRDINGEPLANHYVPIYGFNTLTARILHSKEFKEQYKEIISCLLRKEFTAQYQTPIIQELMNRIRPYILDDPFMKKKIALFDKELSFITHFINSRNSFLKQALTTLT